jgi:5-methyltetrahydrofolate--homocysteine methyltransferase
MFLEGAGFEIVDLGVDVGAEQFIAEVRKGANVVALSALLTTTMVNMRGVVAAITDAGLREQVRIIVGGAPISMAYATEMGADGYAPDASSAARMLGGLLAV